MEIIIKKEKNILNKIVTIGFSFNAKLDETQNGFIGFDIGNANEQIDILLDKIANNKLIESSSKPAYTALSIIMFDEIKNLDSIVFETYDMKSIIKREDLY